MQAFERPSLGWAARLSAALLLLTTGSPPAARAATAEPVPIEERAWLAWIGRSLPDHGLSPLAPPTVSAPDAAWQDYAGQLIAVLAPRSQRDPEHVAARLARRPLSAAVTEVLPSHRRYRQLQGFLMRIRKAAADPERVQVRNPPYDVRAGKTALEVGQMRARLLLEGYGDPTVEGKLRDYWDKSLKQALWSWEKARGLPMTVVLDPFTRRHLNEPLEPLVAKLALALERWRELELRHDAGLVVLLSVQRGELVVERNGQTVGTLPVELTRPAGEGAASPPPSLAIDAVVVGKGGAVEFSPPLPDEILRVADPAALARLLLQKEAQAALDAPPAGDEPATIPLAGPASVHRVYQTITVDAGGHLVPAPDPWKLDEEGLARVDAAALVAAPPAPPLLPLERSATAEPVPVVALPLPHDAAAFVNRQERYAFDLPVIGLDGEPTTLARYKGRLLFVLFFAEWCERCHALAPELTHYVAELAEQGVDAAVVGIAVGVEDREKLAAFVAESALPVDVVIASDPIERGFSAFGTISRLPSTWVLGRAGVPLYSYVGANVMPRLQEDLTRYLDAERYAPEPLPRPEHAAAGGPHVPGWTADGKLWRGPEGRSGANEPAGSAGTSP